MAAVTIVFGAALAQTVAAQDSQRLTVDVHDCLAVENRDERLACFEAQVEAARKAPAAPQTAVPAPQTAVPVAPPPAAPVARQPAAPPAAQSASSVAPPAAAAAQQTAPPAAQQSVARAGEAEGPTPARSADDFGLPRSADEVEADAGAEIVAKVADLRETVPNTYVITLDNGQVWRQTQALAYPLRVGLDVRLSRARWGYRLTAPQLRGQIRVERIR